jgi:hypothetical protein
MSVGAAYSGGKLRTFFDAYGELRFCTESNVLIDPDSDSRLSEIVKYSDHLDDDQDLLDFLQSFSGSLDELYREVLGPSLIVPDLVDACVSGVPADEIVDDIMSPRKRRYSGSDSVNPKTGKIKDPLLRAKARMTARRHASARGSAQRKFAGSAKGKRFYKKLGRFNSRRARSGDGD